MKKWNIGDLIYIEDFKYKIYLGKNFSKFSIKPLPWLPRKKQYVVYDIKKKMISVDTEST